MVLVSSKPGVLVGCIAVVLHFLHADRERETLPCMEEHMTAVEFITTLRRVPGPAAADSAPRGAAA